MTNNINKNNKTDNSAAREELINRIVQVIREIAEQSIKETLNSLSVERYQDMYIARIPTSTIPNYDVYDKGTNETYKDIISRSSDTLQVGDLVRVYFSNITYIGFKL